jgi:hypothetical protein
MTLSRLAALLAIAALVVTAIGVIIRRPAAPRPLPSAGFDPSLGTVCFTTHINPRTHHCNRQDTHIPVAHLSAAVLVFDLPGWHITDETAQFGSIALIEGAPFQKALFTISMDTSSVHNYTPACPPTDYRYSQSVALHYHQTPVRPYCRWLPNGPNALPLPIIFATAGLKPLLGVRYQIYITDCDGNNGCDFTPAAVLAATPFAPALRASTFTLTP